MSYGDSRLEIPAVLYSPEFCQAWGDWIDHRERVAPLPEDVAAYQLGRLAAIGWEAPRLRAYGIDMAIAAIRLSISKGWRDLYPERL